ncbi:hypothetical protein ACFR9U_14110 [Halorientalis brevis]|uniref:PrgI family protein n=1 Tax=Halorientalis brevis TaxID=1126241 RepID=A0ABD6CDP0_9EURY
MALLPGVVVVLCTQVVLPPGMQVAGYPVQALTLPVAGLAIAGGAILVAATPTYTDSLDWLGMLLGYVRSDTDQQHHEAAAATQVERIHPDHDAIERTDGALVALVHVDPPNMALATNEEWAQKATAFQEFLNTVVEFPIQIYSTTQQFPVDEYLAHYEARLDDPDVEANPQLEALIDRYVEWYRADLERRQMTIRDHYVIVPVTPDEVQFDRASVLWNLAGLPVVGLFVRAALAPAAETQQAAMIEELGQRVDRVRRGLREIDGCGSSRVAASEATELLASYWAGEDVRYDATEQVIRSQPIVGGGRQ